MFIVIISTVLLVIALGIFLTKRKTNKNTNAEISPRDRAEAARNGKAMTVVASVLCVLGVIGFLTRSFVIIDGNMVGHLDRIYLAGDLPAGKIIAKSGQQGPQAEILGPGLKVIPFIRVLYDVNQFPVIEVAEGMLGFITAKDGKPLSEGQFIAEAWPELEFEKMLNAEYFLGEGNGKKGPQLTVLRPGSYRINHYLFVVKMYPALDVPTGHVAVIRSNVQENANCEVAVLPKETESKVATPIVEKGCIGVWDEAINPGRYYLNPKAYVATLIPTRIQTWTYKGGYTERKIDLTVGNDGKITQKPSETIIPVPENAADKAINVRVEGWTVPVELRALIQVHPKNAPIVVASVGSLDDVENKIVTPVIRDKLRTIGGNKNRKVLDFISKRETIAAEVLATVAIEARKAGVTVQEIRLGEPAIPPELLVATLREQLAKQLKHTYTQEKAAQEERIKVEKDRATADQQHVLVKAEIGKQAANHFKIQLKREGEGQKLKLMEIAKGQQAQVNVLGKERTMQLQMLEKSLAAAVKNPAIVKVPVVNVISGSDGGDLNGAAAILGSSNIVQMLNNQRMKETDALKSK